jgi:hypothetical protein
MDETEEQTAIGRAFDRYESVRDNLLKDQANRNQRLIRKDIGLRDSMAAVVRLDRANIPETILTEITAT